MQIFCFRKEIDYYSFIYYKSYGKNTPVYMSERDRPLHSYRKEVDYIHLACDRRGCTYIHRNQEKYLRREYQDTDRSTPRTRRVRDRREK